MAQYDVLSYCVQPQVLAVSEALQDDSNFESLDLCNNFLDDLAGQAVASLLRVSKASALEVS